MKEKPVFSVVVPMFNEEESLPVLYQRIVEVMDQTGEGWEFVLVDDGSADRTAEMIREYAEKDKRVRPVIFARNFGHQIAVNGRAGFHPRRCDRDHRRRPAGPAGSDPRADREMARGLRGGLCPVRETREGETFFKMLTARMFYRIINRITDRSSCRWIPAIFRLMDRKVVDVMNQMREHHRFFRGHVCVGRLQTDCRPIQACRPLCRRDHNTRCKKMLKLAMTAITGFSFFPLQVATYLGFISSGISIIVIPIVIVMRLLGNQAFLGQASTLIAVLFLGGVQLIFLGILGEYIGRIYDEVRNRPLYIVREKPED